MKEQLLAEIGLLESLIDKKEALAPSISEKPIGWHIDHSLRVLNGVSQVLKDSKEEDYKWKFNFVRLAIFVKGSFPRGKAKAPKAVVNNEEVIVEDLRNAAVLAKKNIGEMVKLPPKANFKHPYFGLIKRDKTLKFLLMHTHHHYKIMQDILKNAQA